MCSYLPPPAQAQAQPAQAQAHAQDEPPPLLRPPENVLEVGFGGGLVLLVTPLVNDVRLPTAPAEKAETVLTTEAAAFEPGRLGSVMVVDFPPDGMDVRAVELPMVWLLRIVGSARHHQ